LDEMPTRRVSRALPHIHFSYNIFMPYPHKLSRHSFSSSRIYGNN